jgi:hypothetical protein
VTTTGAPGPCEPVGQDAAAQVAPELVLHVDGHTVAHGVDLCSLGQVALKVFPHDAVQSGGLGPPPPVGLGKRAGRWLRGGSRPAGFPLGGTCMSGHRRHGMSRGTGWSISTSRRENRSGGGMDGRVRLIRSRGDAKDLAGSSAITIEKPRENSFEFWNRTPAGLNLRDGSFAQDGSAPGPQRPEPGGGGWC